MLHSLTAKTVVNMKLPPEEDGGVKFNVTKHTGCIFHLISAILSLHQNVDLGQQPYRIKKIITECFLLPKVGLVGFTNEKSVLSGIGECSLRDYKLNHAHCVEVKCMFSDKNKSVSETWA